MLLIEMNQNYNSHKLKSQISLQMGYFYTQTSFLVVLQLVAYFLQSVMNHARTSRRTNLTPKTTEAIIRLRMNGPPVEKIDILHYTKAWLASHYYTGMYSNTNQQKVKITVLLIHPMIFADYIVTKKKKSVSNSNIEQAIEDGVPYSFSTIY